MLPSPHPEVIYKSVSEGAVLFHTGQEVYFGLNSVGAKIWELLPPRCSTWEELITALQQQYPEVDESTLRQDAGELLEELAVEGLVIRPADPEDVPSVAATPAAEPRDA